MAKKAKRTGDDQYRTLADRGLEELRLKTAAHEETFQIGACDWAVNQDTGLITFTNKSLTATAPVQIIGTFNTQDNTWMWAWDHPSVEDEIAENARTVREYGEKHGLAHFTTQKLSCTEEQAWEFTAIACHLGGAQGAYRGPAGTTMVFMTFGDVTLAKAGKAKR